MTRIDKLVQKLRARPPEAGFEDVRRVLEHFGWQLDRNESSHATFRKQGERTIFTVAKVHGRMVKRTYLDLLCDLLGLEE